MKVTVLGLGNIGLPTTATVAIADHDVWSFEVDVVRREIFKAPRISKAATLSSFGQAAWISEPAPIMSLWNFEGPSSLRASDDRRGGTRP